MKRILTTLIAALFVAGAILLPAWHQAALETSAPDCACGTNDPHDPQPANHDADHCPLCQLATVSLDVVMPLTTPEFLTQTAESIPVPRDVFAPSFIPGAAQARAPPA